MAIQITNMDPNEIVVRVGETPITVEGKGFRRNTVLAISIGKSVKEYDLVDVHVLNNGLIKAAVPAYAIPRTACEATLTAYNPDPDPKVTDRTKWDSDFWTFQFVDQPADITITPGTSRTTATTRSSSSTTVTTTLPAPKAENLDPEVMKVGEESYLSVFGKYLTRDDWTTTIYVQGRSKRTKVIKHREVVTRDLVSFDKTGHYAVRVELEDDKGNIIETDELDLEVVAKEDPTATTSTTTSSTPVTTAVSYETLKTQLDALMGAWTANPTDENWAKVEAKQAQVNAAAPKLEDLKKKLELLMTAYAANPTDALETKINALVEQITKVGGSSTTAKKPVVKVPELPGRFGWVRGKKS